MLIFIFTFQENYGNIFLVNNHWVYSLERMVSNWQLKNNVKPDTVLKTFWKNNQRFADLAYDSRFSYLLKGIQRDNS